MLIEIKPCDIIGLPTSRFVGTPWERAVAAVCWSERQDARLA
jgi:hypothetical protein